MSLKKNENPTDAELEILQVLWEKGACTVRQVNEELSKKREVGYTTTLKIMQIMFQEKALLTRDSSQRTHVYQAAVAESVTQKKLLDQFLNATFKGAAMKMVMQALGDHEVSNDELDEIKALIKQKEKK